MSGARVPTATWSLTLLALSLTFVGWRAWRGRGAEHRSGITNTDAMDQVLDDSFPASDPPAWGSTTASTGA
jgi:hypothetical protein